MTDQPPESAPLKAAYTAASVLKPGVKVELIDHLVHEVPPHTLKGLSGSARQKILEAPIDPAVRNEKLERALAILDTSKQTPDYFYVKIPEGISDFEAIDSLNCLFRDRFASLHRDAMDSADLPWLLRLESVTQRNIEKPRKIPIFFTVKGTRNKSFEEQLEIVDNLGLVPADPIEQLLTAMTYTCLHPGVDPFRSQLVRGAIPNSALFNTNSHGVRTFPLSGGRCPIASMSALPAIVT
ncbi:MAG: hypothetical protein RLZZ34_1585 [Verrucomicrobiota bacterium]